MANRSKESYREENAQLKKRIKELEKAQAKLKKEEKAAAPKRRTTRKTTTGEA